MGENEKVSEDDDNNKSYNKDDEHHDKLVADLNIDLDGLNIDLEADDHNGDIDHHELFPETAEGEEEEEDPTSLEEVVTQVFQKAQMEDSHLRLLRTEREFILALAREVKEVDSLDRKEYQLVSSRMIRAAVTKMNNRMEKQAAELELRLTYRLAERKKEDWFDSRSKYLSSLPLLRTIETTALKYKSVVDNAGDPKVAMQLMIDGQKGSQRMVISSLRQVRKAT